MDVHSYREYEYAMICIKVSYQVVVTELEMLVFTDRNIVVNAVKSKVRSLSAALL